jgi:hypothetical protein
VDYVFSQNAMDDIISQCKLSILLTFLVMEQAAGYVQIPPKSILDYRRQESAGATENEISHLPRICLVKPETECTICQEEFVDKEEVVRLSCEHFFHVSCISQWLKVNATCPVCRHSIRE